MKFQTFALGLIVFFIWIPSVQAYPGIAFSLLLKDNAGLFHPCFYEGWNEVVKVMGVFIR